MKYIRLDKDIFCILAVCERCGWRQIAATQAAGWTALARHAKSEHGDVHAVHYARLCAWQHRQRERETRAN